MKPVSTKYSVTLLDIVKPLQKMHFRVRHPENAEYITGIAVTASFTEFRAPSDNHNDTTGTLSLAIPESGDVFYTENIKKDKGIYSEFVELAVLPSFLVPDFNFGGKRIEYFETTIPVTQGILEGYYEDECATVLRDLSTTNYKVRIYLRYQLKKNEDRVCP